VAAERPAGLSSLLEELRAEAVECGTRELSNLGDVLLAAIRQQHLVEREAVLTKRLW